MSGRRISIADFIAIAAALSSLGVTIQATAAEVEWSRRPYRIQALLAIDAPGELAEQLAVALPTYLAERAEAAVGPVWGLETKVASGAVRQRILNELQTLSDDPADEFSFAADKLILLSIQATPDGCEISAREFDRYVARWGATLHRQTRQRDTIAEQTFVLLHRAIAPLAQLETDADDVHVVNILLRGAELPRKGAEAHGVRPGDVLLPIFRRTTRTGELVPKGIQVVPWTFVETTEIKDDGTIIGRIYSGVRRPLGARRRGRVEQIGILLRADPGETIVHLVSRAKPDVSLAGYDVSTQKSSPDDLARVGLSDRHGRVRIRPGETAVQMVFVKHGGELLARVPIVPGDQREVVVPLPEDGVRLDAQNRLAALREELIDVVARRNILMARARHKIEAGEFKQAQELLTALDQLPGRSQFSQDLARERRLHRVNDPRVQGRIDQLIKGTEAVLGPFLDAQPIRQLQEELRAAQNKEKS